MGKHSAAAESVSDAMKASNTQPMLAVLRLGQDGEPFLGVSNHQRSSSVEFNKPGCQYVIGSIAVHEWHSGFNQSLLVSFDNDNERTVVTSRFRHPHTEPLPVRVSPFGDVLSDIKSLGNVEMVDCDYHVSDADLLAIHTGRLGEDIAAIDYFDPTAERLAAFYARLLDAAIVASEHPAP